MTDKEFFYIMSERGYKTKKSISDAFDIPYTTVSKWGCSSTAPEYVKKLILSCSELTSVSDSDSESEDLLKVKLSFDQISLLIDMLLREVYREKFSSNSAFFNTNKIDELDKIADILTESLFI